MSFWKSYLDELKKLEKIGAIIYCIGYSELKRPIFCVQVGNGGKKLLVQYCIHGSDYITYYLSLLHIKYALKSPLKNTVFFIPIINPDGVCLSIEGLNSIDNLNNDLLYSKNIFPFCSKQPPKIKISLNKIKTKILKLNNNSKNFKLWNKNINGIDLNLNFDKDQNTKQKTEKETETIKNFVRQTKPFMTINYHSKGETVCFNHKKDKKFAKEIAKLTTYKLKKSKKGSGDFKEWCAKKFDIPSIDIIVGRDNLAHPISKKHLLFVAMQNKNVITKSLALLDKFKV
ncbi:MAG: hypothetical protein IJ837_01300 [Clostridia bacterium]|nr:hypothetical protein [Clostridia bacterium]